MYQTFVKVSLLVLFLFQIVDQRFLHVETIQICQMEELSCTK